jgi:hypothetical protein
MSARVVRTAAILAVVAAAGLLGSVQTAAACSCAGELAPLDALRSADVVFEGTVLGEPEAVRVQLGIEGYDGAARFRFAVARYFKGQQGPEAAVYTIDHGSACGRFYNASSTYLVYGQLRPDGVLTDFLCSRTRPLANASEDLELLGEGEAPDPGVLPRDVLAPVAAEDSGCSAVGWRGSSTSSTSAWSLGGALLCALVVLRRRAR